MIFVNVSGCKDSCQLQENLLLSDRHCRGGDWIVITNFTLCPASGLYSSRVLFRENGSDKSNIYCRK